MTEPGGRPRFAGLAVARRSITGLFRTLRERRFQIQ